MFQIFRIEHRTTRVGPFQTPDDFTQELAQKAGANPTLKFPGDDGLPLGHIPFCFVFGCLDIDDLRRWFLPGASAEENKRIVQTLKQMGFELVEFLVDSADCKISKTGCQVAFDAQCCREEGLMQVHDLDLLLADSFG